MSSKRRIRRNRCERKIRHECAHGADRHIASHYGQYGVRLQRYWCSSCGGWHVGHESDAPRIVGPAKREWRPLPKEALPPYEQWIANFGTARQERKRAEKRERYAAIEAWENEGGAIR